MSRAPMHRVSRLVCATALVTTFTGGFCACSTAADPPDDTSGSDLARKRRDAGAHGDAHEASAGDATAPDAGGGCDSASGCAIDPAPPRLIAPLSVTHATSRQPALHFVLGRDSDAATIDLCLDPRCTEVVATLEGTGLVVPPTPLRPGPIFWRGRGVRRGNVVGSTYSPTWVVNISHGSTTVDTSWGHAPDIDATGIASIVTTAQAYTNGHTEIWAFSPPDRSRQFTSPYGFQRYGRFKALADVNGDGYGEVAFLDLLTVQMMMGGADGLAAPSPLAFGDVSSINDVESAGDVDGDGFGDLLLSVVSSGDSLVRVAFGGPSGSSLSRFVDLLSVVGGRPRSADFNGDGHPDFVVALPRSQTIGAAVGVVYSGPKGFIMPPIPFGKPAPNFAFGGVIRTGDVNGDGFADVLLDRSGQENDFALYFGGPAGLPNAPSQIVVPDRAPGWVASLCDINGDGTSDLVWMTAPGSFTSTPSIRVHFGGPSGIAATPSQSLAPSYTLNFTDEAIGTIVGDHTGDGIADLVLGGDANTSMFVVPGSSNGLQPASMFKVAPYGTPLGGGLGISVASAE